MVKKIYLLPFVFVFLFSFLISGCSSSSDSSDSSSNANTELPAVSGAYGTLPTITWNEGQEAPTDLIVEVLEESDPEGQVVEASQTVNVNYYGALWDSSEPFDTSFAEGRDLFTFQIGIGQVIQGWDQGLIGKKVGDRVLLILPPEYGYGSQDQSVIPANSTLVFVVDIVSIG